MLEGRAIKEVLFSEPDSSELMRLESEFYTAKTFALNKTLSGEQIIDLAQYGTSKELNEEGEGYPVLRLNEFQSHFIGEPAKYCNLLDEKTYESLKLAKNDVLICRTNGNPKLVGKSALVPDDYEYAYASYLFKIKPHQNLISSAALVAYLNCRYGRKEIEKFSMASNQVNFSPAKFREMRFPNLGETLNKRIEEFTYQAFELLKETKELYKQAENLLLKAVGLKDFEPSKNNTNVKSLKESLFSSGRLDAEFYQLRYEQYQQFFAAKANGKTLGDLAVLRKGYQARSLSDKGILYASIKDADGFLIETNERTNQSELVLIEPKEIVLAITGATIGKTGINAGSEEIAISGDLVAIKPNNISPYYLQLVLSSTPIQELCRKYTTGATNGHLTVSDVASFPIPLIEDSIQEKISQNVISAIDKRNQSKNLLELAKRAVELAIEETEEKAVEFIEDAVC